LWLIIYNNSKSIHIIFGLDLEIISIISTNLGTHFKFYLEVVNL